MNKDVHVEPSSGNIFADLELEDSDELLTKSDIAWRITEVLQARGLNQSQAAARYDVDQPRLSHVINGHLDRFSLDWLIKLANKVGLDVGMTIAEADEPERPGRTFVNPPCLPVAAASRSRETVRFD